MQVLGRIKSKRTVLNCTAQLSNVDGLMTGWRVGCVLWVKGKGSGHDGKRETSVEVIIGLFLVLGCP